MNEHTPVLNSTDVIWENGEFSPMQIEEISEAFSGDLDKAKAVYRDFTDGCATGMDFGDLLQIGREIAVGIPYTMTETAEEDPTAETERPENHKMLVDAFEGAFTEQEAVSIAAAFDWDVDRAASLYRELTEDYVSHMTVEALIKAGKE